MVYKGMKNHQGQSELKEFINIDQLNKIMKTEYKREAINTSKKAFEEIKDKISPIQEKIIGILINYGINGLTTDEITQHYADDYVTCDNAFFIASQRVRPRLTELLRENLIEKCGERESQKTNKLQNVWRLCKINLI